MKPEQKIRLVKYLYDALLAAEEIEHLNVTSTKNFESNNIKWVVERGIEIISEALRRASLIEPNLPITGLNKIFATRNKIANEYDLVDPSTLLNCKKEHSGFNRRNKKIYQAIRN